MGMKFGKTEKLKYIFKFAAVRHCLTYLKGINFREFREFFRKFPKINPRENLKNLWIREI